MRKAWQEHGLEVETVSMVLLLALGAMVAVILVVRRSWRNKNLSLVSALTQNAPPIPVSISSLSFDSPVIDVGTPTAVGAGLWVINPKSSFPLTIYPASAETSHEIKALLADGGDRLKVAESLRSLMVTRALRCKEVDDYVARFRPKYVAAIETLKQASHEWSTASQLDREDLLQELRAKAVETLEMSPAAICDVPTLFECQPDFDKVRELFTRDEGQTIKLCKVYRRYAGNERKVYRLPADDRYRRPDLERLCDAGLAARGLEIAITDILNTLTLKDLRGVVADTNPPLLKRKAEAVQYAAALGGISERLAKTVVFRELFQLRPLPEDLSATMSELFSEPVMQTESFAHEAALLIAHTYTMGSYDLRDLNNSALLKFASGWKITAAEGSCPTCRKAAAKVYQKAARPRVPLHIGCRCDVEAKLK